MNSIYKPTATTVAIQYGIECGGPVKDIYVEGFTQRNGVQIDANHVKCFDKQMCYTGNRIYSDPAGLQNYQQSTGGVWNGINRVLPVGTGAYL
ncbi:hypothetical protein GCM10009740_05030 [Terrabacter terrae]|uniref:Uncharacterized protein n=1 Tax=Terrabacter terrae TaxID=318434 RepID=A0ABN2TSF6_9MICO